MIQVRFTFPILDCGEVGERYYVFMLVNNVACVGVVELFISHSEAKGYERMAHLHYDSRIDVVGGREWIMSMRYECLRFG